MFMPSVKGSNCIKTKAGLTKNVINVGSNKIFFSIRSEFSLYQEKFRVTPVDKYLKPVGFRLFSLS